MTGTAEHPAPLAGVRILDVSEGIAGPYAASLLAVKVSVPPPVFETVTVLPAGLASPSIAENESVWEESASAAGGVLKNATAP